MNVRLILTALLLCTAHTRAQDSLRWGIQAGLTFSNSQQQVKAEVGDPRGERLALSLDFGVMTMATYQVWDYAHVGLFVQYDRGDRVSARFNGFDPATGRTVTKDKYGGKFSEFWAGPFVRAQWRYFFGEFGWGLIGIRDDALRADLPSASGDTTGTFDLLPSVAVYAGLGVQVPFNEKISLVVRLEYRLRYYEGRAGDPFMNNFEHGMQNITPFVGVGWRF